jgi:uncharacterized protein YceH (UPF0502 family)
MTAPALTVKLRAFASSGSMWAYDRDTLRSAADRIDHLERLVLARESAYIRLLRAQHAIAPQSLTADERADLRAADEREQEALVAELRAESAEARS